MRKAAKHIGPLVSSISSVAKGQQAAQYAVPAVASTPSVGLLGGKRRIDVPMSEPLPGLNIPKHMAPKAPELQVHYHSAEWLVEHSLMTRIPVTSCTLLCFSVRQQVVGLPL